MLGEIWSKILIVLHGQISGFLDRVNFSASIAYATTLGYIPVPMGAIFEHFLSSTVPGTCSDTGDERASKTEILLIYPAGSGKVLLAVRGSSGYWVGECVLLGGREGKLRWRLPAGGATP